MRTETNNNMGATPAGVDVVAGGECRVAIERAALHKRGRLNNQSSNTLDAVVGHRWTIRKNPNA
jgi:hypothetical protein